MTPKELWVQALRSGKYQQGTYFLRSRDDKFCCLGVACDLYQKITGQGHWIPAEECFSFAAAHGERKGGLPFVVREWLGVRTGLGDYQGGALFIDNDRGKTFLEIADIIESAPGKLFS